MAWTQRTGWTTAKKTNFNGKIFDSKFEAGHAQEMELRKKAKDIKDYSTQVNFPLIITNPLGEKFNVGTYIADFVIYHNDGSKEIWESKGFATPVFRQKWRLVEALYSHEYKLTCVMMGKGKLRQARKVIDF